MSAVALTPALAESLTIDFERLPDGRAPDQGMLLTNEYRDRFGVRFPSGVEVAECDPNPPSSGPCRAAQSGDRAIQPRAASEFTSQPIDIRFDLPVSSASLYISHNVHQDDGRAIQAEVQAFDASGNQIASDAVDFTNDGSWNRLEVDIGQDRIARLVVSGGATIYPDDSNFLVLDDLTFELQAAPTPLPPDNQPPQVTFLAPTAGAAFDDNIVDVQLHVEDNREVARVSLGVAHGETGTEILPFRDANICGSIIYGPCANPLDHTLDVALDPTLEGVYTARVEACDAAGLCAQDIVSFGLGLPVDVWVMGIEYNQAVQDFVFTDLDRSPGEAGLITLDESAFGMPVIPGKPLAVRVYVGVRQGPGEPIAPPEGFAVTGELDVTVGDAPPQTLGPIDNPACTEQSAALAGQACLPVIQVHPSLGRVVERQDPSIITETGPAVVDLELPTRTDYDLDLIDQRARLEGTLNFVLPPELTAAAADGLTLRALIQPVGRAEATAGDNVFELQLGRFAQPNPLNLRLVRVTVGNNQAPTTPASVDLLTKMLELMPYDSLALDSNQGFFYDGSTLTIRLLLFGLFEVAEEELDQCQTLWLNLFDSFGLDNANTLLALSPASVDLSDCGGLGWLVPGFGGIALAESPTNTEDDDQVGTMAQETYHAKLDRRHVSDDHEEDDGCFLEDGILADIIGAVGFDTDCWKPAPYLHGSMGEYPRIDQGIFGDRGAVGVEIEPDGPSWRLTLYDPCPTGGVDHGDPLATLGWIGRRWDDFAFRADGFNLPLCGEHNNAPHDFMSYGDNPWTSVQQFLGETEIPEGLSLRSSGSARGLLGLAPQYGQVGRTALQGEPGGTQVSAFVTQDGAGFASFLPSPSGTTPILGPASSPLVLVTESGAGRGEYPMAVSFVPGHPRSMVFLTTSLPPGVAPERMEIQFRGQTLAAAEASEHAPEIRLVSPNGGETWSAGEVETVQWEVSDADGDPLRLRVEYSTDAGGTWQPIGTAQGTTSMSVTVDELPASGAAMIRMMASDGMRLAQDASDATFCVGEVEGCAGVASGGRSAGPVLPLAIAVAFGGMLFLAGLVLVAVLLLRGRRRT